MESTTVSLPRFYKQAGALAQMVEQWTENPCVPGSIPGGTTKEDKTLYRTLMIIDHQRFFIGVCGLVSYRNGT